MYKVNYYYYSKSLEYTCNYAYGIPNWKYETKGWIEKNKYFVSKSKAQSFIKRNRLKENYSEFTLYKLKLIKQYVKVR